ncbi:MAG: TonB-dependent receptor, partial [Syntrophothermus sp.]
MKKFLRYVLLLVCLITYSAGSAFAQSTTGKISGKVTDAKTKEALPFITIVLEGTNLGAASDIDGFYTINNVSPGTHKLKVSAVGYQTSVIQNVKVNIGLTTNIDIQLNDMNVTLNAEVVITAERPLVQKDLTASTSIVGQEMISSLPVTEIRDVLQLQAGMTVSGGDLHLRGGRAGQIAYQIDGVPVTDAYDGNNVIDVATQSIQELQVVSGAFNAEFGQAMSGIVNIVTKDGSNNFTGNVQAYTGTYMSNRENIFWGIKKFRPSAVRNVEGSLSGAIVPDKLFFFVNGRYFYNQGYLFGKRDYLTTDLSTKQPDGSYLVTQHGDGALVSMNPNTRYNGQGKLTYRLTSGVKLTYNYIYDYQNYKDFNQGNRLTPDNNLDRFRKGITNTLGINHALSSNTFYMLNLSYFFKNYQHYLFKDIYTGDPSRPTLYVDNTL